LDTIIAQLTRTYGLPARLSKTDALNRAKSQLALTTTHFGTEDPGATEPVASTPSDLQIQAVAVGMLAGHDWQIVCSQPLDRSRH
jgi:hypothetical protein